MPADFSSTSGVGVLPDSPKKPVIAFLIGMPSEPAGAIDFGYDDDGAKPETAYSSIINSPAQDAGLDLADAVGYDSAKTSRARRISLDDTGCHADEPRPRGCAEKIEAGVSGRFYLVLDAPAAWWARFCFD